MTEFERDAWIPKETCEILMFLSNHLGTLKISDDKTGWLTNLRYQIHQRIATRFEVYGNVEMPNTLEAKDFFGEVENG